MNRDQADQWTQIRQRMSILGLYTPSRPIHAERGAKTKQLFWELTDSPARFDNGVHDLGLQRKLDELAALQRPDVDGLAATSASARRGRLPMAVRG